MTLTITELEKMRSVDIGAVDTQTPPNLDGAAFQILTSVQKNYQLQILSLDRSESHCSVSSQTAV